MTIAIDCCRRLRSDSARGYTATVGRRQASVGAGHVTPEPNGNNNYVLEIFSCFLI